MKIRIIVQRRKRRHRSDTSSVILQNTLNILRQGDQTQMDIARLQSEVAENTTAIGSAIALLGNLSTQIRDNAENADAIREIADQLDANTNALANAVAANTVAEDEEEPAPVGDEGNEPPLIIPLPNDEDAEPVG